MTPPGDHRGMAESPDARDAKELVRWLITRSGGDPRKVAKGAGVTVSTIRKWKRGQFPTQRCSTAIHEVHSWATDNFPDYPPPDFPRGGLPALVAQPSPDTTPTAGKATARRRLRLRILGALLGLLAVLLGGPLVANRTPAQPVGQRPDFEHLDVGEPPSAGELASPAPCRAANTDEIYLPDKYRGHVFVQLMTHRDTPVHLKIVYGPNILELDVIAHPGVADRHLGGTLIQFNKDDTTIEKPDMVNPPVKIRTSEPVCILTGTAADHVIPRPVVHLIPPGEDWTTAPPAPPAQ
jgi:hypothetical protein